ncbi:MAG: FliG C-terminal domain-containing protein [Rubripirellula sp.]
MSLLTHEHPQTQAVVLSLIPPRRAASLLPMLPVKQRQDMLSRIGRLRELPAEMFSEIAGSFQEKVEKLQAEQQSNSGDGNPLQALIDAYAPSDGWDPAQAKTHVPAAAAAVSPRLQAILSEMPTPSSAPVADENASETATRLRSLSESSAIEGSRGTASSDTASNENGPNDSESIETVLAGPIGTDEAHQELVAMSSKKLCESLGRVSTRVAILTLCGLPNEIADAAINELPRSQANQVRSQLMNVGSMEIRDIDRAKEEVVRAARVISTTPKSGESNNTSDRRKVAA